MDILKSLQKNSFSDWSKPRYPQTGWSYRNWYLDTTVYISSPSSVRCDARHPTSGSYIYIVLTGSVWNAVREGQIDTYLQQTVYNVGGEIGFCFHYFGNNPTSNKRISVADYQVVFNRYRFTFWNSYDYQNNPKTQCHLEGWTGTVWYDISTTFVDRRDSGLCRVGMYNYAPTNKVVLARFDDTFVYK